MVRIVKTIIVFLVLVSAANATTYYVDTGGSDSTGNGSIGSPWASLSHACDQVSGDNKIHINAGSYTDNSRCTLALGVDIEGADDSTTTITSSYSDFYIWAVSSSLAYGNHDISGFTLNGNSNALQHGIYFRRRHNVVIHDMTFINIYDIAIDVRGDDYATPPSIPDEWATGFQLYNTTITNCGSGSNGNGAVHLKSLNGASIHNNTINESGTAGLALRGVSGHLRATDIYNNTFTVASSTGINCELWNMMDGSTIHDNTFNYGFNSFVSPDLSSGYTTPSCKFYNNVHNNHGNNEFSIMDWEIYRNFFNAAKTGDNAAMGFWKTENYDVTTYDNNWVYQNVMFDGHNNEIIIESIDGRSFSITNMHIDNNIFDSTDFDGWGPNGITFNKDMDPGTWNVSIYNNIFLDIAGTGVNSSGSSYEGDITVDIEYNYFDNVNTQTNVSGAIDTVANNLSGAVEINESGNKPSPYYEASSGSANIVDAGTDVGLSYYGAAPDIGRYEYIGEDTADPYTYGHNPSNGATNVSPTANIVIHIADAGEGVNISTIQLTEESSLHCCSGHSCGGTADLSCDGDSSDYTVTLGSRNYSYSQVVDVSVDASDLAGTPNTMTTDVYSYTIMEEPGSVQADVEIGTGQLTWESSGQFTIVVSP